MYKIRRSEAVDLPTGPNPLPPLSEFEIKKTQYQLNLAVPFGMFSVDIDLAKETGFFEHAFNGICGQFWLAGHVLVASDHILPADVRAALKLAAIDIA